MDDFMFSVGPISVMRFGAVFSVDFLFGDGGVGFFMIGWRSIHFRRVRPKS